MANGEKLLIKTLVRLSGLEKELKEESNFAQFVSGSLWRIAQENSLRLQA